MRLGDRSETRFRPSGDLPTRKFCASYPAPWGASSTTTDTASGSSAGGNDLLGPCGLFQDLTTLHEDPKS